MAGRRLSKHLKACIGPWWTAVYDSDRQVSRAAQDSFVGIFDTEKRREIVKEKYGEDVLRYILQVLENESARTISMYRPD